MLNKIKKLKLDKSEQGFTIIEVMIVLAIAGLIILIVLLAVPALQRNGRNTAIKNDASAIVAGVSEFASNNDGALPTIPPTAYNTANGTLTFNKPGGTPATAKLQTSTTVVFTPGGNPGSTPGKIVVIFKKKCGTSTSFNGLVPTSRATAVLYNVEGSSGVGPRCLDS